MRFWLLLLCCPLLIVAACFARPCYTPEQAAGHSDKEICLQAHVYDMVESEDGTRYLDVCKPDTPDESCRFTIVSLPADRKEVGSLDALREQDIQLRGVVHTVRGQSVMLLSHARQLHDGAEKFRPNPQLMSGFSAGSENTAFSDPAMRSHRQRSASLFKGAHR